MNLYGDILDDTDDSRIGRFEVGEHLRFDFKMDENVDAYRRYLKDGKPKG